MQKLLTVTINIEKLKGASKGPFTTTEIEGINSLLHEGWMIQDWEFITAEDAEKAIVLLILNDEMAEHEFDVMAYGKSEGAGEDEDELFEENDDQLGELADDEDESDEVEDVPGRTMAIR